MFKTIFRCGARRRVVLVGLALSGAGCAHGAEAHRGEASQTETPEAHARGPHPATTPSGETGGQDPGTHGGEGHQHRFEDPAAYAAAWESPERDAWQQPAQLVATLGVEPGMQVADIGTGTGYLLRYLSAAAGPDGRVYAVDVEPAMVEWVSTRARDSGWANVTPLLAPADGPGVPAGSLDRAIMVNVWHHIAAREVYARHLLEALRPGAQVLVVETRLDAPDGPPLHYRLPPEQVVRELQAGGFLATLTPYTNSRQYAVRATRPTRP